MSQQTKPSKHNIRKRNVENYQQIDLIKEGRVDLLDYHEQLSKFQQKKANISIPKPKTKSHQQSTLKLNYEKKRHLRQLGVNGARIVYTERLLPEKGLYNFRHIEYEAKQADVAFAKTVTHLSVDLMEQLIDTFEKVVAHSDSIPAMKDMRAQVDEVYFENQIKWKDQPVHPQEFNHIFKEVYKYWKRLRDKTKTPFLRRFHKKCDMTQTNFRSRNTEGYKLRKQRFKEQEKLQKLLDLRDEAVKIRAILIQCMQREKMKGLISDLDYASFKQQVGMAMLDDIKQDYECPEASLMRKKYESRAKMKLPPLRPDVRPDQHVEKELPPSPPPKPKVQPQLEKSPPETKISEPMEEEQSDTNSQSEVIDPYHVKITAEEMVLINTVLSHFTKEGFHVTPNKVRIDSNAPPKLKEYVHEPQEEKKLEDKGELRIKYQIFTGRCRRTYLRRNPLKENLNPEFSNQIFSLRDELNKMRVDEQFTPNFSTIQQAYYGRYLNVPSCSSDEDMDQREKEDEALRVKTRNLIKQRKLHK